MKSKNNSRPNLVAKDLSKSFGRVKAISGVTHMFLAGNITLIGGRNGSGKTTLLKMLAGLLTPDHGVVLACDINGIGCVAATRDLCAYVSQQLNVFRNLSVTDNIELLSGRYLTKNEIIRTRVQLNVEPDEMMDKLSFAEMRIVQISGIFESERDVLLLDEPTAGLGASQATQVLGIIREATKTTDRIVIMTSHHSCDELFADEVVWMEQGKIAQVRKGLMERDQLNCKGLEAEAPVQHIDLSTRIEALLDEIGSVGVVFDDPRDMVITAHRIRSSLKARGYIVAFVPEDRDAAGLFYNLTVKENLALRVPSQGATDEDQALGSFGITYRSRDQMVSELSGGNAQRLLLLRECSSNSDRAILVEPGRGIDSATMRSVAKQVRSMLSHTPHLVFSTSQEQISSFCDAIFLANEASIAAVLPGERRSEGSNKMNPPSFQSD